MCIVIVKVFEGSARTRCRDVAGHNVTTRIDTVYSMCSWMGAVPVLSSMHWYHHTDRPTSRQQLSIAPNDNFIILSYIEASIFGSISSISNPRLSAEMIDCVTPSYNTATARRLAGTHEEWFYLLMNKSLCKGRKYGQWCRPRLICGFRGTVTKKDVLSRARR